MRIFTLKNINLKNAKDQCSRCILTCHIFLLIYVQLAQTMHFICTFGLCPSRLFHVSLCCSRGYVRLLYFVWFLKKKKKKKKLLPSSIFMQNGIFRSTVQCPLHLWPVCADVIARPSPIHLGQKHPLAFWQEHLQQLFVAQPLQFIGFPHCKILSIRICMRLDF